MRMEGLLGGAAGEQDVRRRRRDRMMRSSRIDSIMSMRLRRIDFLK